MRTGYTMLPKGSYAIVLATFICSVVAFPALSPLDIEWKASHEDDFHIANNTRCSGHYKVASLQGKGLEACEQICRADHMCSAYSLEGISGKSCFLFSSDASCDSFSSWITGHKDTRCVQSLEESIVTLQCPFGSVISKIDFASYGNPTGGCGEFKKGQCHAEQSVSVLQDLCVGETKCTIAATSQVFSDPCPGTRKNLRVHVSCEAGKAFNEDVYFNAWSSRSWPQAIREIHERKEEWETALATVPRFPTNQFQDNGIIIVAGGRYLQPAVVLVHMLRETGCTLRIQIWHVGSEEMTNIHRQILTPYDVETRDFRDYVDESALQAIPANVGMRLFQLKPLALLHTDLLNVLLLDSDNCPIKDPSYLFQNPTFLKQGTIFWPDYWKTSLENPIWKIIDSKPVDEWEQESGQILVNKEKAWKGLNLAVHFNSAFYMKLLNGDKDTFRFAFKASQTPFHMMSSLPTPTGTLKQLHGNQRGFCGHTMVQHDFEGKPLFVHHNQLKTTHLPIGENFKFQKTPGDIEVFKAVPVTGLHLSNGEQIPCTDLEGVWLSHVDEDQTVVSEANLQEFEQRYFAAQNSIPASVFNGHKQRAAKLQQVAPTVQPMLVRQRRNGTSTGACGAGEFNLTPGTCELIATCGAGETQGAATTDTTDNFCSTTGGWPTYQFEVEFVAKTSDHGYFGVGNCPNGFGYQITDVETGATSSGPTLFITRTVSYEFVMKNVPSSSPFYITAGTIGGSQPEYTPGVSPVGGVSGTDSLFFEPVFSEISAQSAPDILYYHSTGCTNAGFIVHSSDPTWDKTYVGVRRLNSGPQLRFSTAYNADVRLFTSTSGPTNAEFIALRSPCQDECTVTSGCRGIHIFITDTESVCYGLSDLGGAGVPTLVDSQSWAIVNSVLLD